MQQSYQKAKSTIGRDSPERFSDVIGDNLGIDCAQNPNKNYKAVVNESAHHDKFKTVAKTSKLRNERGDYRTDREGFDALIKACSNHDNKAYYINKNFRTCPEPSIDSNPNRNMNKLMSKSIYTPMDDNTQSKFKESKQDNALPIDYSRAFAKNYNLQERKRDQNLAEQLPPPGKHEFSMSKEKVKKLLSPTSTHNYDPKELERFYREKVRKNEVVNQYAFSTPMSYEFVAMPLSQNSNNDNYVRNNTNNGNVDRIEAINKIKVKSPQSYKKHSLIQVDTVDHYDQKLYDKRRTDRIFQQDIGKLDLESNIDLEDKDDKDSGTPGIGNDSKTSKETVIEIESATKTNRSDTTTSSRRSLRNLTELENSKVNVLKAIASGIDKFGKLSTSRQETRNVSQRSNQEFINSKFNHRNNDEHIFSSILFKQNQQNEREHHYETIKHEIERLENMEKESFLK